uniref:tRNA-dihydrouridine(16/17) synthase [NAD(P)(+)] n=1 Tax=Aureoumbra lagunensis TaxID=44058 RepID=A0A7S3K4J3_9STRA
MQHSVKPRKVHLGDFVFDYPILALAPMVGQCDRPFRELCRKYRTSLCYTEMLKAEEIAYNDRYFQDALANYEEGALLVQLCTRNAQAFTDACLRLEALGGGIIGVDLNLGCPQQRAKDGGYGAYLAEESYDLCCDIIRAGRRKIKSKKFVITAKIRLHPNNKTLTFAKKLQDAGVSAIALHARFRGRMDARRDGAADLSVVKELKSRLSIPVLSNGNVRCAQDVLTNLSYTQADGVLVAEELLRNPSLFSFEQRDSSLSISSCTRVQLLGEYLDLCASLDHLVPRKDNSLRHTQGNLMRAPTPDTNSTSKLCRYSNWWPNIECIKHHCKQIIQSDPAIPVDLFSRNTYRKATCPVLLDAYLRKRLRLPPPSTLFNKHLVSNGSFSSPLNNIVFTFTPREEEEEEDASLYDALVDADGKPVPHTPVDDIFASWHFLFGDTDDDQAS